MAKRLLFILFLIQNLAFSQAWVYHPFPTQDAIWENRRGTYDPPTPGVEWDPPYYYCMGSDDTLIGTQNYSKLSFCGGPYAGALRDDGIGKIYYVPSGSASEFLIYDFSLNAGDTVTTYCYQGGCYMAGSCGPFWPYTYTVQAVDSVLINGSFRKRLHMEDGFLIEGIGNSKGLFIESWANVSNYTTELVCMSELDTVLYPTFSVGPCSFTDGIAEKIEGTDAVIFPNPSSGTFGLELSKGGEYRVQVCDVLGRSVQTYFFTGNRLSIDLSGKAPGAYLIRLSDDTGGTLIRHILKQ